MDYKFRSACIRKLTKSFSSELIDEIKKHSFSPSDSKDGFVLLESSNDVFLFQYLRKINYTYGDFQGELIQRKGETIKDHIFEINLDSMLLIIYAGKSQSDFLVRKLENICGNSFISVEIEFAKILEIMKKSTFISRMEQVELKNFQCNSSLVGRYIPNVYDYELFKDIIEKYCNNLLKVTLSFESYQGDTITLTIGKDSSFLFRSYSENNSKILTYVLSNLL
ncbi:hypothetical protein HWN40_06945 [Methanolobus zinderi]|uniref:Uncharacterized protein n=1 Tax=Methanolobus zinderi TaxID=536044 RepID=A0A7D5EED9_9EURY|nr:hypothetical protein [Methanolobus zinderi]KXS41709.1 MAG: hypothetical protein AWU59_1961 [Methanolobus sp. T82-4]QLC49996.1 hypothetical protein HWN40_06945 [Methanolobus zinderi]